MGRSLVNCEMKITEKRFQKFLLSFVFRYRNALTLWAMALDGIYFFVWVIQCELVEIIKRYVTIMDQLDAGPNSPVTGAICRELAGYLMSDVNEAILRVATNDTSFDNFLVDLRQIPIFGVSGSRYRKIFSMSIVNHSGLVAVDETLDSGIEDSYKEKK